MTSPVTSPVSSRRPTVVVPVRRTVPGVATLVLGRRPDGTRTGLAFGSVTRLERACGPGVDHVVLSLSALRAMLAGLGVHAVQLDAEAVSRPAASFSAVS